MDETTRKALEILRNVWGSGMYMTGSYLQFIRKHGQQGETALATCARLAGADVSGITAFAHQDIMRAAVVAELKALNAAKAS